MLQKVKGTLVIITGCINWLIVLKIKINEGIPMKYIQISSVERDIDDTIELKEEQVQESEKEDSESDDESANTQADSRQQTETKATSRIILKVR